MKKFKIHTMENDSQNVFEKLEDLAKIERKIDINIDS